MISIIVPHHTETIKQMTPLLSSLNAQVGIDFSTIEVLIINDDVDGACKVEDFSAFENIAPRIRIFFNEQRGYMGISRQIGIDNACGEYLVFCDADDAMYCNTVLFDLSTRQGADVYSYGFIEQTANGQWIEHPSQFTWMFAKSYRKQFLVDHNIRFSNTLLWHEDTYFNQVLLAYSPKVEVLSYTGYMWLYSPGTITRRNNAEYTSKSMCMFIDALDERFERVKYVLPHTNLIHVTLEDIVYLYVVLQNRAQVEILDQVRGDIEARLAKYIAKHDPNLVCLDPRFTNEICAKISSSASRQVFMPSEGFEAFIRRIMAA